MTNPFFDKAIPKSDRPQHTQPQTSWRQQDERLDRRERARARAKNRKAPQ